MKVAFGGTKCDDGESHPSMANPSPSIDSSAPPFSIWEEALAWEQLHRKALARRGAASQFLIDSNLIAERLAILNQPSAHPLAGIGPAANRYLW